MEASQPQPPADGEPTVAQAMEIAKAAMEAAQRAEEKSERRVDAEAAAAEEAEAQGVSLSTEQQEAIADMTVAKMEQLGAFGPPEGEGEGEGEGDALAQGVEAAAGSPQSGNGSGGEGAPAQQQPQPPTGGVEGPADEPPVRKSLAERFQGR
jgi:hypothetical protein